MCGLGKNMPFIGVGIMSALDGGLLAEQKDPDADNVGVAG